MKLKLEIFNFQSQNDVFFLADRDTLRQFVMHQEKLYNFTGKNPGICFLPYATLHDQNPIFSIKTNFIFKIYDS